jgi:biopolymer transport protein ExbB
MLDYLLDAFAGEGQLFMYAVTALLAFVLAVGLERIFFLGLKWRLDVPSVTALLRSGKASEAAAAAGASPVAGVLSAGAAESDPEAAWEAMGAAAAKAQGDLSRRVDYVAAVANMATMLGLLGTVYGLMLAFSGLGDASAGERAVRLSEGISTAMATTAYGLLVGIPSLGLHSLLTSMVDRRVGELEQLAGELALALRKGSSDG